MDISSTTAQPWSAVFAGSLVPDEPAYRNPGLSQAGNRVQAGFVEGLRQAGVDLDMILSYRPVPAYPADRRIWIAGERRSWQPGCALEILPTFNLLFGKHLLWGLAFVARMFRWSFRHRGRPRVMFCYNLGVPPCSYLAARLTGTKIVSILYDAGQLASLHTRLIYRLRETLLGWMFAWTVKRLDGRAVITEAVAADFAPGRHFLLVDGGVEAVPEEPHWEPAPDGSVVFFFAGTLWETNGVSLMLEAMERMHDSRVRLWIAGDGARKAQVEAAAARDPRIVYLGKLSPAELHEAYRKADVLLNTRVTSGVHASPYLFPSKLLECLATGKPVISTAVAHARRDYGAICRILDAETPAALAAAMTELAGLPAAERRRCGDAARAFMLANRTWQVQGARLARYVETCVLGRSGKESAREG